MKSINLIKPYFFEKRFLIFFGLVCLIVVDFLQLFIPRIIKWAVDDITAFRVDAIRLSYYALYIVGIAVLIALFGFLPLFGYCFKANVQSRSYPKAAMASIS